MPLLDPRTVERIANVIVDADGPYERRGWEVEGLLRRASWPGSPEYDGSPRVSWLTEILEQRHDDPGAIERLICRICDPVEYDNGTSTAEDFRHVVNGTLEPEGLAVTQVNGRPVLGEVDRTGAAHVSTPPPDLARRLHGLIEDHDTVAVLVRRANETRICEEGGAHTLAIIGIGSLVEGLLYAVLTERDEDARNQRFLNSNGDLVHKRDPNLAMLIDTVHAKGWIQLDATQFMHQVRDFRNYVHPRKERAEQPNFDADSVGLCWGPVHAILNDLEQQPQR